MNENKGINNFFKSGCFKLRSKFYSGLEKGAKYKINNNNKLIEQLGGKTKRTD